MYAGWRQIIGLLFASEVLRNFSDSFNREHVLDLEFGRTNNTNK